MKVAMAYLIFKAVGVMLICLFFAQFIGLVEASTATAKLRAEEHAMTTVLARGSFTVDDVERIGEATRKAILPTQIANAHSIVNVFIAVIFMPFLESIARLITSVLPAAPQRDLDFSIVAAQPLLAADVEFGSAYTGVDSVGASSRKKSPLELGSSQVSDDDESARSDERPLLGDPRTQVSDAGRNFLRAPRRR
jgi:hypothetical protein